MLIAFSCVGVAQTTLTSGDIAIIGLNTEEEDFSFVSFVNLPANTKIYFTDEEANGTYEIPGGEGTLLFTSPAQGIDAGIVITRQGNEDYFTVTGDGDIKLANTGDGLLAYQGAEVGQVTTFLHAVGEDMDDIGTFPNGFSNYITIDADDGQYSGTRIGSASDLMSSINNISNWITTGSNLGSFDTSPFTINNTSVATITLSTSVLDGFIYAVGDGPSEEQSFTVSGTNLNGDIVITPPTDYEISSTSGDAFVATNPIVLTPSGGSVTNISIYTRLKSGLPIGTYNDETITTASDGAVSETVICNGLVCSEVTSILISRNCDPKNNYAADRYCEIYNTGTCAVDLSGWTVENIQNGNVKFIWSLTGTIADGETKVLASSNSTNQTVSPDYTADWVGNSWNGEGGDGTVLKNSLGVVVDSAVQNNATGKFENKQMKRKLSISTPSAVYNREEWVFTSVDDALDVVPGFHGTVWCGNSLWNTESNWDNELPIISSDVMIPSGLDNYPEVNADTDTPAICHNLTIADGASLSIRCNKALTVYGDVSNTGTFTIMSNMFDSGSLIVKGSFLGEIISERFLVGYNFSVGDGWHLLSSPVDNMLIADSDFEPEMGVDDLYMWSEAQNLWLNYCISANNITHFTNGIGYMVAYSNSINRNFIGSLNTEDITELVLSHNADEGDGWNLLGNPFSSALKWDDGNWVIDDNMQLTAKIRDELAGNYIDVNANDIIPSNQGFFVQVNDDVIDFIIPAAAQVHDETDFYKESKEMDSYLKLKIASDENSFYDIIAIHSTDDANDGYDKYDSEKLFGNDNAPQFYSYDNDLKKLSTQSLNPSSIESGCSLQLGLESNDSNYYISVKENTFDDDVSVILEDCNSGDMFDLSLIDTCFFSVANNTDRFVLHFNNITTSLPDYPEKVFAYIYSKLNNIYINSLTTTLETRVIVYNVLGQVVVNKYLNKGNEVISIAQSGVYIVKVFNKHGAQTKKVIIS